MTEPAQAPVVPHGWNEWAGLVSIGAALAAAYLWWRNRIYEKGRRDQRREDEARELRAFRQWVERRLGAPPSVQAPLSRKRGERGE